MGTASRSALANKYTSSYDGGASDLVSVSGLASSAGANTPSLSSNSASSPDWCIETRMSHPPMNSFCGGVSN